MQIWVRSGRLPIVNHALQLLLMRLPVIKARENRGERRVQVSGQEIELP